MYGKKTSESYSGSDGWTTNDSSSSFCTGPNAVERGRSLRQINIYYSGFLHFLTSGFPGLFQDFKPNSHDQSRNKHEQFRRLCVLRAYAGFWASYFKKHVNYFKLGVNEHVIITTFPWLFQNFYDLSFSHDFSRPGNDHLKIPWLFQVFHDRTNPDYYTFSMSTAERCARLGMSRGD